MAKKHSTILIVSMMIFCTMIIGGFVFHQIKQAKEIRAGLFNESFNSKFAIIDDSIIGPEPPELTSPTVTTNDATDIQSIQAQLNGNLIDLGGYSSATVWFEWGVTISYGNSTSQESKSSPGPFSRTITGLSSGITYHFRAVARNTSGTSYGLDKIFTTSSSPPIETESSPAIGGEVWGWAWSENIGWISFNCLNDYNGDGVKENHCTGPGYYNYGVHICTGTASDPGLCAGQSIGTIVGYAWSRGTDADVGGVGWITFNPNELSGCPQTPCKAWLDTSDNKVYGWARSCVVFSNPDTCSGSLDPNRGNWDGWIKLRGFVDTNNNGIRDAGEEDYGISVGADGEFRKWAWGGDDNNNEAVIGWLSFNCENCQGNPACDRQATCDGTHKDYKVYTTFAFNRPPEVRNMEVKQPIDYCTTQATGKVTLSWLYHDEDNDTQTRIELQVDDNPLPTSSIDVCSTCEVNRNLPVSYEPDPITHEVYNSQYVLIVISPENDKINYSNTYNWRVRVWDENNNKSAWTYAFSFTTASHAWPWPNFTYSPDKPAAGELVTFIDNSTCYDPGSYSCKAKNNIYLWTFGDGITSPDRGNTTHSYTNTGTYTVNLKITDYTNSSYFCDKNVGVNVSEKLPEWEEIPPY